MAETTIIAIGGLQLLLGASIVKPNPNFASKMIGKAMPFAIGSLLISLAFGKFMGWPI